ncbi:hypothetical protein WJX77_000379 [Trebouxia sp. C0004]
MLRGREGENTPHDGKERTEGRKIRQDSEQYGGGKGRKVAARKSEEPLGPRKRQTNLMDDGERAGKPPTHTSRGAGVSGTPGPLEKGDAGDPGEMPQEGQDSERRRKLKPQEHDARG